MSIEQQLNHFSIISRLFGNLFYRLPTDPILHNVFHWLSQQQLTALWPLSTDEQSEQALKQLQSSQDLTGLTQEYLQLFDPEQGNISTRFADYQLNLTDFLQFRQQYSMPEIENPDHIALLFLTASWLEDNVGSVEVQKKFFQDFLLPCASVFLGKVEAFSRLAFYRCLAQLSRDILAAMADELEE